MTTIGAYLIIALFMFAEGRLRKGTEAKSYQAGESDQDSTRRIGQAFALMFLALLLAPILNAFQIGTITVSWLGWLGLALMLLGFALRVWSAQVLGEFYTRTLRVKSEQRIVDAGPYKLIRNPGYLGNLVMFTSAGLAVLNWIAVIVIAAAMLWAYLYRIRSEETMLQSTFGGDFTAYKARTWRLVPLVY